MKANPPQLAEIAAQRAGLWDAGYRPLPVYSFDHADRSRAGKAPLGGNWEKRARQNPPECTRFPAVAHAANTGVLADGLRAIDIDIDEPALARRLRRLAIDMLGDTLIRSRDNSGRCLLPYRAKEGAPKKRVLTGTLGKIEVLGFGQQFVAHGVHPSGASLHWKPVAPEHMPIEDLPAVTEAQITAFFDAAAPLIDAEAPKDDRRTNGQAGAQRLNNSANADTDDILDVISALAAIPNYQAADWEFWNNIGMATWAASGGSEFGFAAWHAWSAKHVRHNPELCRERWEHYPSSPPDQTGSGKLYALAAEAHRGWRRPSEQRREAPTTDEAGEASNLPNVEWRNVRLSDWQDKLLAEREWIIPEWIPREQCTGLYGVAGINKTDFLVQLMMATSLGLVFCGYALPRQPVYGLFCEDTEAEIVRRATRIAAHYGLSLGDFTDFHFASLVGFGETEFVTFDGPKLIVGPALVKFDQSIVAYDAKLTVLDTAPDFFGGEEISRRQVSQFVRRLDAVSMTRGCALLFSAHPSVRGATSGAFDSGSTGWGGKVRARLSLHDPGDEEDEEEAEERKRKRQPAPSTDRRILTRQKSNYARQGETIELLVHNGVFTTAALDPERAKARGPGRNEAAEAKFLELLTKVIAEGGHVNDAANNPANYAPSVFASRPDRGGISKPEFFRAMQRLRVSGRIRLAPRGPPSRGVTRWEAP